MQWTVLALCTGSATGLYVLYSWLLPALQSNAWWALFWNDNIVERLRDTLTQSTLIYARQTNHKKTIRYHPVCDLMNLLCIPGAQRLLNTVQHKATHGDPESVISDIDHFCKHSEQAMNVGDEKGSILDLVLSEVYPSTALELGTHCGYSGVRIVHLLRPDTRLITVELNPAYASIAQQVIAHAGLQDKITLEVGSSSDLIPKMKDHFGITLNLVFLDHWQDRYLPDIKLLENCGLLREGSVLLADGITCPGTPDYLDCVRNSPHYESHYHQSHLEYTRAEDGLEKSVFLR